MRMRNRKRETDRGMRMRERDRQRDENERERERERTMRMRKREQRPAKRLSIKVRLEILTKDLRLKKIPSSLSSLRTNQHEILAFEERAALTWTKKEKKEKQRKGMCLIFNEDLKI